MAPEVSSSPPTSEGPRLSSIDWRGKTSALLESLETSSRSIGSNLEPMKESGSAMAQATAVSVKDSASKFFGAMIHAGGNTKKETHVLKLRAAITVWEREVSSLKQNFGIDLFSIMDRNFNMGDKSGGEAQPELVEIFTTCNTNVKALLELRKRKQTDLTLMIKPDTICMQSTGDDTKDDISLGSLEDNEIQENLNVTKKFHFFFNKRIDSTKDFFDKQSIKNTLKSEISELDKDLISRKAQFGCDMYDTMEYLVDQYEPREKDIESLYESYKTKIDVPYLKILTAEKELEDVRTTGYVVVARDELKDYVSDNPPLWAMLDANISLGEVQCKMICMRVVSELITGLHGKEAQDAIIRKRDFLRFEKMYVKDPKGSQEFFHRCVFASFDSDHNGILNKEETDNFLDTLYQTGSVFQGNTRLPEKAELKTLIIEKLDKNGKGEFTFNKIRSLISGNSEQKELHSLLFNL